MFAGFVGRRFVPGRGIVFIAINPGGGGDAYTARTPEDEVLYPLLENFRDCGGESVLLAFERVNETFTRILPHWNLWRILEPTLAATGRSMDEVAYLNVVPYRTRQDEMPPIAARRVAWARIVDPTLCLIKSVSIVTLGRKAGSVVESMLVNSVPHFCVPRVIGDSYVSEDARRVHSLIRGSLQ